MNKEFYFKGLGIEDRRRLGIINLLIDKELPQKIVLKEIKRVIDDELDDGKLNNALKPLRKMGIIKNRPFIDKRNRLNNLLFIPKNHTTLQQLLEYLYSKDDAPFLLNLKRYFIHSKYAKNLINPDLVLKIQSELQDIFQEKRIKFIFNEEEKQLILKILQNSPSALYYVTNLYYDNLSNMLDYKIGESLKKVADKSLFDEIYSKGPKNVKEPKNVFVELGNELKNDFIFNLLTYLSQDISKFGSPEPIEYTTSIKFLQKELEENYIYVSNVHFSQVTEEDRVKNTIKTHSIINRNITKNLFE